MSIIISFKKIYLFKDLILATSGVYMLCILDTLPLRSVFFLRNLDIRSFLNIFQMLQNRNKRISETKNCRLTAE